jgi:glutamate N-acetyltransferase / amino-acid N-acetyltransferase
VAGSNLTKCAIHGADPNWGRILCAVGYSGAQVDPVRLECTIGGVPVVRDGTPLNFDQAAAHAALSGSEVSITVDLHLGAEAATAWGCDLTEGYVRFNSEYST